MKKKSKILEDLPRPEVDKLAAFYLKPGDKAPESIPDSSESQVSAISDPQNNNSAEPSIQTEKKSITSEVVKSKTIEVPKLITNEVRKIESIKVPTPETSVITEAPTSEVRKFDSYEILTIRISTEHLEWLNGLELKIRKMRKSLNPRITKNSIIRALLYAAQDIDIDFAEISDEDDLAKRIYEVMKLRSVKLQDS